MAIFDELVDVGGGVRKQFGDLTREDVLRLRNKFRRRAAIDVAVAAKLRSPAQRRQVVLRAVEVLQQAATLLKGGQVDVLGYWKAVLDPDFKPGTATAKAQRAAITRLARALQVWEKRSTTRK